MQQENSYPSVIKSRDIASSAVIGAFVHIHSDVKVGDNVTLHDRVTLYPGVTIGAGTEIWPGAVIGRRPGGPLTRQPEYKEQVNIGKNCSIGANAVIYCDVQIGDSSLIGDGVSLREQCRIGSKCIIGRNSTLNYNCQMGDECKIMDLTHLTGNMTLGDQVFISAGVISTNDNQMRDVPPGTEFFGPTIGSRTVVGGGAIFLPATMIGEDAIIGAGSVVTRSVPAETRVMGIPAREK